MTKIIHLTDTHLFADRDGSLRGTLPAPCLEKVLEHVHEHHPQFDALMITGDLVQEETEAAYQHFIDFFGEYDCPVLCLPGNHDVPGLMHRCLDRAPFRLEHRVELGDWNILQLDSHIPGSPAGKLGAARLEALEAELKAAPDRHTLVGVHHPPLKIGTAWLDTIGLKDGAQLLELLGRHPQVRALIWGHAHQHWDSRDGDLRLLGTPATCAQFLAGSPIFAIDPEAPPAYRTLELSPDGGVETELYQLSDVAIPG